MLEIIYWWSMETIFIYLLFWFIYDKWFWWWEKRKAFKQIAEMNKKISSIEWKSEYNVEYFPEKKND